MADQYFITYTGNDVVKLGRSGLFQKGTTATVDKETAEQARAMGDFSVRTSLDEDPTAASKAAAAAAPPAKKAETKSEAKIEPKKEEKAADAAPAAEAAKAE